MLVQGIIVDKASDRTWNVRIPCFESAGMVDVQVLECTISHQPGNVNIFFPGDVVVVGFIENALSRPIILGELYTGGESNPTNSLKGSSLEVSNDAVLPSNTLIGGVNIFDELKKQAKEIESLKDQLASLQ